MWETGKGLRISFKREKKTMKIKIMTCEGQHWTPRTFLLPCPLGAGELRWGEGMSRVREKLFWTYIPTLK